MGDFMKNSIIKSDSKKSIKGKRIGALKIIAFSVGFCAISTLISSAVIFVSDMYGTTVATVASSVILILLGVFSLLIYSSVSVGEKAWYSGIAAQKRNCSKRFCFWFRPKNSFRAFRFKLILFFIKLFWAAVFFLPGGILLWSIYYLSGTGGLEMYLFISLGGGSILLMLGGAAFFFAATQKYFIAEYIFSSDPRLDALTAIRQSKNLLDGHILELVRFKLSFIPWLLSCFLIIPAFYFIPYYKESCSMVAKRITL